MTYNPDIHYRQSIRLKGYDYSATGAYFVTICSWNRECIFGDAENGIVNLSTRGEVVYNCWIEMPNHFKGVGLDQFIIMPNHIHGIIAVIDNGRGMACHAPTRRQFGKPVSDSLSTIVGSFKAAVTKRINRICNTPGIPLWQRNYYEHIIRTEEELNQIRKYILDNPLNWEKDDENPNGNQYAYSLP